MRLPSCGVATPSISWSSRAAESELAGERQAEWLELLERTTRTCGLRSPGSSVRNTELGVRLAAPEPILVQAGYLAEAAPVG